MRKMSILSIPIIDWKSGHCGSRTIYFPTQSNGREPANDVDSIQSNMLQQISYSTGELLWRQQKQRLCKVMGNGFPREKSTWLMRLSQFVFMYRDNWLIQELGQQNSSFVYFIPITVRTGIQRGKVIFKWRMYSLQNKTSHLIWNFAQGYSSHNAISTAIFSHYKVAPFGDYTHFLNRIEIYFHVDNAKEIESIESM